MAQHIDDNALYDLSSSTNDEKTSLLYSVLPKLVRTRIRRLPSLRRSMSQYALGSEQSSPSSSRRTSGLYSDLGTPPPGYQSRASLLDSGSDIEGDESLLMRPLSSCSNVEPTDSGSGILWKFANQGLSLLNIAAQEDKKKPQERGTTPTTSLSRSLYVHGVTYMLRGLPTDLSVDEKMSIWTSIPPDVQQVAPVVSAAVIVQPSQNRVDVATKSGQSSVIQQVVAGLIVQMFVISQFLLPYIKYCLAILYKYERKHKISERVLASSMQTCDGVMRTGLKVTGAISRMNDGKVGQALNEMSISWISGVTAGIHQGVGEGLAIVGAKDAGGPAPESKKRR